MISGIQSKIKDWEYGVELDIPRGIYNKRADIPWTWLRVLLHYRRIHCDCASRLCLPKLRTPIILREFIKFIWVVYNSGEGSCSWCSITTPPHYPWSSKIWVSHIALQNSIHNHMWFAGFKSPQKIYPYYSHDVYIALCSSFMPRMKEVITLSSELGRKPSFQWQRKQIPIRHFPSKDCEK